MDNIGILKRNGESREVKQFLEGLTYREALIQIWKLREKGDGNYYWIGKIK